MMKKSWLDHPARPSNLNRPTRPSAKPSWMENQSSFNHPAWLDHSTEFTDAGWTNPWTNPGWFIWVLVAVAIGAILFCVYYCLLRPIRFLSRVLCGWCENLSSLTTEQPTALNTITDQLPPPTTERPILTNVPSRNQIYPNDSNLSDETESNGHSCSICFMDMRADDRYQVAFNPCGHSCCNDCSTKLDDCHVCRLNVTTKIRLY